MRFLLVCFTLLFASSVWAFEVDTMIHDIDPGQAPDEETLIFLSSGLVVTVKSHEKALLHELQDGLRQKTWFRISYNEEREITDMKEIASPLGVVKLLRPSHAKLMTLPYQASILKDMDVARSFFYDARINHKESQCYNRAHSWTYDWRVKRNLYSNKTWLFFTKRFIRKYKFDWWFHVAPSVLVYEGGEVRERVMDMKYARGPLKLKTWTDIFMRDNADCPVVQKYSDHANFPESGSCFVMRSSMYYYQPVDLEQTELTGIEKSAWIEPEVRHAFEEAFEVQL